MSQMRLRQPSHILTVFPLLGNLQDGARILTIDSHRQLIALFYLLAKTEVQDRPKVAGCVLHGEKAKHSVKDCRQFLVMTLQEKRELFKKHGVCFRCCAEFHLARDCKEAVLCTHCGSKSHSAPFHIGHGGERTDPSSDVKDTIGTKCTQICGTEHFSGKSCAKCVLVKIYPEGQREKALKIYAIVDDQSNRSLAHSKFFDYFSENSQEIEYILSSCAGEITTSGRRADGYILESLDGQVRLTLPTLIECDQIPNNRQ